MSRSSRLLASFDSRESGANSAEQFWFHCPSFIGEQVRFLSSVHFQCRVCLRLTYESQRERQGMRLVAKGVRLRKRLGGSGYAFSFGKPKGDPSACWTTSTGRSSAASPCSSGHPASSILTISKKMILDTGNGDRITVGMPVPNKVACRRRLHSTTLPVIEGDLISPGLARCQIPRVIRYRRIPMAPMSCLGDRHRNAQTQSTQQCRPRAAIASHPCLLLTSLLFNSVFSGPAAVRDLPPRVR
jgi:hypothetical protein